MTSTRWRNWSGLEEAAPSEVATPTSVEAVVEAVRRAREAGTTVKMVGTGHSFTAIAAPEHTLLQPDGMRGVVEVDREAMTVTARAGTALKDLNLALERLGLSLHHRGDIAEQTLAGPPPPAPTAPVAPPPDCPPSSPDSSWSPAPARCCAPRQTRTPTSSRWPASGSARSAS